MKTAVRNNESFVVNVVPPSTTKRRGSSLCSSSRKSISSNEDEPSSSRRPHKKRQKSSSTANQETTVDKLNPSDPVHARRLEQRQKALSKGKNTAGYDAYIRQVPKESRRPRSMDTPATPDPTLDIPQKRWNGQVSAWRKALHKYDPPDLLSNDAAQSDETKNIPTVDVEMTVEKSCAVPATPTPAKRPYVRFYDDDGDDSSMDDSPISVKSDYSGKRSLTDFDQELSNGLGGDDSDDDIL